MISACTQIFRSIFTFYISELIELIPIRIHRTELSRAIRCVAWSHQIVCSVSRQQQNKHFLFCYNRITPPEYVNNNDTHVDDCVCVCVCVICLWVVWLAHEYRLCLCVNWFQCAENCRNIELVWESVHERLFNICDYTRACRRNNCYSNRFKLKGKQIKNKRTDWIGLVVIRKNFFFEDILM